MTNFDNRLNTSWWVLRIGLGVGPIITGIDKHFNKLTDWGMYLSPLATKIVPVSAATFMDVVGVVEIAAGIIVLSRWTKFGSYLVTIWLLGIAANLLTTGMFYDLAMRDVEIALGGFALSQLTAVRRSLYCWDYAQCQPWPRPKPTAMCRSSTSTVSKKAAADPDSHTRACALKCEASGFGILTKDNRFLKFDARGNKTIAEELKASDKKNHLRVDVSGDVQDDTLKVTSVKLL
jgi:uncharacterized membrane protein YphA (DoxX/SURF4 family)